MIAKLDEQAIFHAARRIESPEARRHYLDDACGADAELQARVEALLRVYDEEQGFLQSGAGALHATLDRPLAERPGTLIGAYKLLEQIGEGGFGVVFMAEQQQPVRRKVALKILKPGMDTRQVVARFEAERQALALMDHPNIAHVFDGGTVGQAFQPDATVDSQLSHASQAGKPDLHYGRPYFVMELVRGVPITEFCDESCLAIRQRLELFGDVCQAVQHAHQKGIIHRDIKPTNVLVTLHDGTPVAKVIDFGIAKALGQQLTEKTLFTNFAQLIGTPLYMSPEQAEMSGLDVDTRSDIYSLGVLLYELLTGTTPFEHDRLSKVGYDEMRRIIREEEPPRPSARISTIGKLATTANKTHQGDTRKLGKLFRGELDWIVMKALEKDRNRRYETANGFARDVERYLADEPVLACPPSANYRLRKFVRRNKRVLASAAALILASLMIAGTLGWAVRDRDARAKEAARERASRRLLVEQAVARALERADELQNQGKWPEALLAAERAQAALASGDAGAELQEQVRQRRADLELIQRLEELRTKFADDHNSEIQDLAYARLFAELGIDAERLSPAQIATCIRSRPAIAVRMATALDDWAKVRRDKLLHQKGDPATWKRLLDAARLADPDRWRARLRQLTAQEDLNGLRQLAESADIAALPVQSLDLMSGALAIGGDHRACLEWLRKAQQQHPGDTHINFDLAFHLSELPVPPWDDVLRFYEAALAARPESSSVHMTLGWSLLQAGRLDEAYATYRRALVLAPWVAKGHHALGQIHARKGQWKQAAASLARAIELDPKDNWSVHQLGFVLAGQGDLPPYREYCDTTPSRWGTVTDPILAERTAKACLLLAGGVSDLAELAPLVQRALSAGENHEAYPWFVFAQGLYDYRCGRFADALTACRSSGQQAAATHNEALLVQDQSIEAMSLYRLGQTDEARQVLAAAGRLLYEKRTEFGSGDLREWWTALLGARVFLREAEETMGTRWPEAIEVAPNDAKGHSGLGQIYARRGQWKEAAAAFDRALAIDPENHDGWILAASLHAAAEVEGYRRECARIVERFADATEAKPAADCAKVCLLLPDALSAEDFERVQTLAERAVTGTERHRYYSFFALAKGLADYRAGRYVGALQWIAVSTPSVDGFPWDAVKFALAAMARHRLGHEQEAAQELGRARTILAKMPDTAKGQLFSAGDSLWHDWIHAQVLCREAEALLKTPAADTGNTTAIEGNPNIGLGQIFARKGQWKEAAASLARAVELAPKDHQTAFWLGCVLAEQGDLSAYQEYCDMMLLRWSKVTDPMLAERTAKACLLLAGGVADPAQLAPLVHTALSADEMHELYMWFLFVQGLHDYRCGRFAEARTACAKSRERAPYDHFWALHAICHTVEAMSLHRLGKTDEARQALAEADRLRDEWAPKFVGDLGPLWDIWLQCRILRREAQALMKTPPREKRP